MPLKLVQRHGETWYIRGSIHGKRYEESTGTTSKRIAEEYRIKREADLLHEHIHGKQATATFAQAALHYLEQGGERRFMQPVLLYFAETRLADIGQEAVDRAALSILPAASGATRSRQVYGPVSAVLHHAARLGWCPQPILKRPRASRGQVRWLTKAEADLLIQNSPPHLQKLIVFLLYTGCRVGEALSLDWKYIDLQRRQVQFIDTKNGYARGVPLHTRAVALLEPEAQATGPVFRTHKGKAYSPVWRGKPSGTSVGSAFGRACRNAGVGKLRVHDLRHTWATWHYIANRDLGALQRLGGWRTPAMVFRYAHVNVDELQASIDRI